MTWTLTPGEEGFMLSRTEGHMSEPWGIIMKQDRAMKLIEWLEWGETLEKSGMIVSPKPPKALGKRRPPVRA